MTPPPSPGVALARARASLEAARTLTAAGHHADAVSRAFYASLYAALALLASVGIEARTHKSVRSLIAQHFIRTGKLPHEASRALSHVSADRDEADYDLAVTVTAEDAAATIAAATRFVDDATGLLTP